MHGAVERFVLQDGQIIDSHDIGIGEHGAGDGKFGLAKEQNVAAITENKMETGFAVALMYGKVIETVIEIFAARNGNQQRLD